MYVLVILPPPDPTCCGRLSRNCVELLYGTLTTIPSWLSYTVPLLYPSDWVPQIIKGGTRTPSTVCPFGALPTAQPWTVPCLACQPYAWGLQF